MFVKSKLNLSILIPCYNWNVYEFIHKIHLLCQHEDGLNQFEIICIEDASPMLFANQQINGLQYVKYEKLNKRSNMVYGTKIKSNYQFQGLNLSKHFKK